MFCKGEVWKDFNDLPGTGGKEYLSKYKQSEKTAKKLLLRWQPLRHPWLSQGLHASAQGWDLFVQAQMAAGGSTQNLAWDWEILPNSFRMYQLSSVQFMARLRLWGRRVFLTGPDIVWGAQSGSSNVRNSGGPCHPVVLRPASLILTWQAQGYLAWCIPGDNAVT